jgi:hypothetical protein
LVKSEDCHWTKIRKGGELLNEWRKRIGSGNFDPVAPFEQNPQLDVQKGMNECVTGVSVEDQYCEIVVSLWKLLMGGRMAGVGRGGEERVGGEACEGVGKFEVKVRE